MISCLISLGTDRFHILEIHLITQVLITMDRQKIIIDYRQARKQNTCMFFHAIVLPLLNKMLTVFQPALSFHEAFISKQNLSGVEKEKRKQKRILLRLAVFDVFIRTFRNYSSKFQKLFFFSTDNQCH